MRSPYLRFSLVLMVLVATADAGELIVFPAVTDELPGEHNSLWVTDAQIIKLDPRDEVTVTRKWVCLPNGGFEDDPASQPPIVMSAGHCGRMLQLWGLSPLTLWSRPSVDL